MSTNELKYKIKGNESFSIHEGWLAKGLFDRNMINEYLDRLRQEGFIELNRTAGLDMVYISKKLSTAEILEIYYTQSETEV